MPSGFYACFTQKPWLSIPLSSSNAQLSARNCPSFSSSGHNHS